MSECEDCPANYRGPQGRRGNDPFAGNEGGFPCDRFIKAKKIETGRDADAARTLNNFLATSRKARNKINDNQ